LEGSFCGGELKRGEGQKLREDGLVAADAAAEGKGF